MPFSHPFNRPYIFLDLMSCCQCNHKPASGGGVLTVLDLGIGDFRRLGLKLIAKNDVIGVFARLTNAKG